MEEKRCSKCKEIRPMNEFTIDNRHRDGRRYECKVCSRLWAKRYREKNLTKCREQSRASYAKCKDKIKERRERYIRRFKEVTGMPASTFYRLKSRTRKQVEKHLKERGENHEQV
jgi:hypothetical protein